MDLVCGQLEDIIIENEEFCYKVNYYKTIKKPNQSLKMAKRIGRDKGDFIVKHIAEQVEK